LMLHKVTEGKKTLSKEALDRIKMELERGSGRKWKDAKKWDVNNGRRKVPTLLEIVFGSSFISEPFVVVVV